VFFNESDMKEAQEALGYDDAGRPYLEIKYQHSGEMVNIPPGWPHAVYNLRVSFFFIYSLLRVVLHQLIIDFLLFTSPA